MSKTWLKIILKINSKKGFKDISLISNFDLISAYNVLTYFNFTFSQSTLLFGVIDCILMFSFF